MSLSASSWFFITFIFSTIILPSTGVASQHCKNFSCGKFQNLGYPFGRIGSNCGDPDFQLLDCDGEGGPYLRFNYNDGDGLSFHLKKLYPEYGSILFEIALNATTADCHSPLLQLKSGIFTYGSTYNFSVQGHDQYLFCGNHFKDPIGKACDFYWFPSSQHTKALCEDSDEHIVTCSEANLHPNISDEVIRSIGFLVEARIHRGRAEGCYECLHGIYSSILNSCGYDSSTLSFQCFPPAITKYERDPKPIIVLAVLGMGALILLGRFIFHKLKTWRKRKNDMHTVEESLGTLPIFTYTELSQPTNSFSADNTLGSGVEASLGTIGSGVDASLGTLPIFTYTELSQATNSFSADNILGRGGFATVFQGKLRDGRDVAVKKFSQDITNGLQDFMKEALAYKNLNHPRIVRFYGCSSPAEAPLMLVFELVDNGTLAHHLHGDGRHNLTWNVRLKIAIQIAEALAFLHNSCPQMLHRDVKSANILLDENFDAKVADFGISRLMPMDASHATTHPCGTLGYIDPEYFESFELTEKSDVYSYGVVLMEIVSSKRPVDFFRDSDDRNLAVMAKSKMAASSLHELVDGDVLREAENNTNVKDMVYRVAELACRCFASKKNERPTMREVASDLMEIRHDEAYVPSRPPMEEAGYGTRPLSQSAKHVTLKTW